MCIISSAISGIGAISSSEASAGLGIIGAGVQALGAIGSGNAQAAQANYAAQVAANNQIIAQQNAAAATQAGEAQAQNQALRERSKEGAIRAAIGAAGIDVNTGSAVDVRSSQAELGQENVETVRHDAALHAYGYRTQATNFGAESELDRMQAGYDVSAGWLKGIGSLLGAAPSLPKLFGSGPSSDLGDWSPRPA